MKEIVINLDERCVVFEGNRISYGKALKIVLKDSFDFEDFSYHAFSGDFRNDNSFVRIGFSDFLIFLVGDFYKRLLNCG